jgi:SagB-type dehydrogenase family enzyme
MTRTLSLAALVLSILVATTPAWAAEPAAQPTELPSTGGPLHFVIRLPAPDTTGSMDLERALATRRSVREYAPGALTLGQVGQLAWAAQGITSPDGKRTAPSARAVYPLTVYFIANEVAGGLPAGVYCYEPRGHLLGPVFSGERRAAIAAATPRQAFISQCPLVVVVAGDSVLAAQKFGAHFERWLAMEAGFVVQNIYLEVTALGLGTLMVGSYDDALTRVAAALPAGQVPLALMPVGKKK